MNYHCPACARKSHVRAKCRLEAENQAKKEAELRAIAKIEKDKEERGLADELAGAMNEFFAALYVDDLASGADNLVPSNATLHGSSSTNELPLASPDSITVTTEFGVLEETGNVTIISASGPSPHHAAYDNDTEDESNVEMTENLHNDHIPMPHSHLQPSQHSSTPHLDHMQDLSADEDTNDTGEEGDIDTDDFDVDAASAIIEEFLDEDADGDASDGLLTPVATASN